MVAPVPLVTLAFQSCAASMHGLEGLVVLQRGGIRGTVSRKPLQTRHIQSEHAYLSSAFHMLIPLLWTLTGVSFKLQLFILQLILSFHPILNSFPWSGTELLLLSSAACDGKCEEPGLHCGLRGGMRNSSPWSPVVWHNLGTCSKLGCKGT